MIELTDSGATVQTFMVHAREDVEMVRLVSALADRDVNPCLRWLELRRPHVAGGGLVVTQSDSHASFITAYQTRSATA